MSKSKKSRGHLLGEAVCGFVNAQTSEEACFRILTGIQKISGSRFSSSFIEKVKEVFPTIGNITPPPKKNWREEVTEITTHEDKVLSALREKLGPPLEWSLNRDDQSFVARLPVSKLSDFGELPELKQALVLRALMRTSNLEFDFAVTKSAFLPVRFPDIWKAFSSRFYPTTDQDQSHRYEIWGSEEAHEAIVAKTSGYESVLDDILDLQGNLQKSWTRHNTIVLHLEILNQKKTVRGILDSLVFKSSFGQEVKRRRKVDGQMRMVVIDLWLEMLQWHRDFALDIYKSSGELRHQPIREDDRLFKYLKIYNKMPRPIEFDQQDSPRERHPIREEYYLGIDLPLKWLDRIKSDLAYCLVEFLINEANRKHIGKCPKCKKYNIAERLDGRIFCSKKCRKDWHNLKQIESGEAAKYKRKKRKEGAKLSYYG